MRAQPTIKVASVRVARVSSAIPLSTIAWVLLILTFHVIPVKAAELRPYKHPALDMQFTAPVGWPQVPRPGDESVHERVDPETGIHVLMWYTSTEQSAERYLVKMADMMGLDLSVQPMSLTLDGRQAWLLETAGTVDGKDVWSRLAVIPSGKSHLHPRENNLYIVKICCPVEDHIRLEHQLQQLISSVRITDQLVYQGRVYRLYPKALDSTTDLPSPLVTVDRQEFLTIRTRDDQHALVPVTVENGAPNAYEQSEWDKGRQLHVDADDFPTLAATGLHSEAELDRTVAITGVPLADIDAAARPGASSVAGFVAENEAVLAVIKADNQLVRQLGLTHPDLARPLFKVFNLILRDLELYRRDQKPVYNIASLFYGEHEIHLETRAAKGWQQSIFDDEVRGYWQISLRRDPTEEERRFLDDRYGHLGAERLAGLGELLFSLHTGEMVPFYIQRYGFYEGHTWYRADPIAIAVLFGLITLEDADAAVGGDLLARLTAIY